MSKTFDEYADLRVRIVAVPLPPAPIENMIILPECFSSSVCDIDEIEVGRHVNILAATFSEAVGPVVLITTRLSEMINFDRTTGLLSVHGATFCAGISFYRNTIKGQSYADYVTVNSFSLTRRSCHPGSHYIVPKSPTLTALLQFAQSPALDTDWKSRIEAFYSGFEYLPPEQGALFFPACDWSINARVETYLSQCAAKIRHSQAGGGLGEWSVPYMQTLFRNQFLPKPEYR